MRKEETKEVILTEDVVLSTDCARTWGVEIAARSPLELLGIAAADDGDKILDNVIDGHTWKFECKLHKHLFNLWEGCPDAKVMLKAGEKTTLSNELANRLLLNRQAQESTAELREERVVQQDHSFASQLERCNALMETMGFPEMNKAGIEAINMRGNPPLKGKNGKTLYRKRGDKDLARALELSQDDIAEMRDLIKD